MFTITTIQRTWRRTFMTALGIALVGALSADLLAQGKKGSAKAKEYRLAPLSSSSGSAFGMNEAVVAGTTTTVEVVGEVLTHPCHWTVVSTGSSQTIVTTPLMVPENFYPGSMRARDINREGVIVGHGYTPSGLQHGLAWSNAISPPIVLPLPAGFEGWGCKATNVSNAVAGSGIILGTIDGAVPDEDGDAVDAVGLIVWRFLLDDEGELVVSPPTWFGFSDEWNLKTGLNDGGWIALTDGVQAHRYRLDWDWAWDPDAGQDGDFVEEFFLAEGEGDMFGGSVQWARVGGVNQAGDAAAFYRATNSLTDTLVAKRLNGSILSFPAYATHRDEVTRIESVYAINDATNKHAVQVLGKVGKLNTRNGSYQSPRPALWEAGQSVRLLQDITDLPTDAQYYFLILGTSMYDLNDASWICGQTQRQADGVSTNIPTVLIRNP